MPCFLQVMCNQIRARDGGMAFLLDGKPGERLARWAERGKTLCNIIEGTVAIPGLRPSLGELLGLRPGQLPASSISTRNRIALQVLPSQGANSVGFAQPTRRVPQPADGTRRVGCCNSGNLFPGAL